MQQCYLTPPSLSVELAWISLIPSTSVESHWFILPEHFALLRCKPRRFLEKLS